MSTPTNLDEQEQRIWDLTFAVAMATATSVGPMPAVRGAVRDMGPGTVEGQAVDRAHRAVFAMRKCTGTTNGPVEGSC